MFFFFKRGRVSDFVTISITYYLSGGEFKYIYRHTHTHTHTHIHISAQNRCKYRCSVMPKLIQLINFVCMCCNVSSLFSHSIQTQHLQKKTKKKKLYWLPCINSALLCLFQLFSHLHGVGTARCLDFISKINDLKEIKGSPCDSG